MSRGAEVVSHDLGLPSNVSSDDNWSVSFHPNQKDVLFSPNIALVDDLILPPFPYVCLKRVLN
jgi:hypothetical protein